MAEYIDRDKFCHFLFKEIAHVEETQTDTEIPISLVLQSVVNEVKKFKSEDVQPVKHGRWKWSEGGQCSECGFHNSNFGYNYCPNCGADMRGG